MIFCYSVLVCILFFIFLYLSFKNRFSFAYIYFNFLFFTHIIGIVFAEFFGIMELDHLKNIYDNECLNGASAIYILFTIFTNLIFLKTINNFKIPICQRMDLVNKLHVRNINFVIIYVLFLFVPFLFAYFYIYTQGNIPLLEGATDMARVKVKEYGNLFNIIMTVFFPIFSSIFILLALVNKKSFLIICFILIQLMIYPILMAHRSAMFMVLFYPVVTTVLYYGIEKVKFIVTVLSCFTIVYFMIFMFLHFEGKYDISEIFWKLMFRLFVAQGSNFYLIWTDFVNDKLPYLYNFSFLKQAFYSSVLQIFFDDYLDYIPFEHEITLYYTSEWFATSWNLATTTLGEAVFTFGIVGILFLLILIVIYIQLINFLFKKFISCGNVSYLGACLLLVSYLNNIWNMGGYYQLFSINMIFLFFICFIFFYILNLLLKDKIVISN